MGVIKTVLYVVLVFVVIACLTGCSLALNKSSVNNGNSDVHIELSQKPTDDNESVEQPSTGDESGNEESGECEHVFATEHTSDLQVVGDVIMGWDPIGIGDLYTSVSLLCAFDTSIGQQQFYCLWAYRGDLSGQLDGNLSKLFEKCYFLDTIGHVLSFVDSNKTDYFVADYVEYSFKFNDDIRILGFSGLVNLLYEDPAIIKYTIKSDVCALCGQKRS